MMNIKAAMINMAINFVMARLDSEEVKKWIDMGLDILEDKAEETPNKMDDFALKVLREAMSIPDNDEE